MASQTMTISFQPNMQGHEELAALFSRNLTFNPDLQVQALSSEPQNPARSPVSALTQPSYSISQHYHHSGHIAKPSIQLAAPAQEEVKRPSSEPPQTDTISSETVLHNHGIDASTLTPSQLQLFRIADPSQQRRLVELWSICPPSRGGDIPALAWSSTTLEQEEQLARLRYDRLHQNHPAMSLDGTPIQTAAGTWARPENAEPYMAAGYDELLRREHERQLAEARGIHAYGQVSSTDGRPSNKATDPVYMGPDYARQQQEMEMASQYGAFEQFRGMGEADAMDVM